MPEEKVNVLVMRGMRSGLPEERLRQITEVSPIIKAQDASDLTEAVLSGDSTAEKQLDALLAEAEVIYGHPRGALLKKIVARAPKLKWIQTSLSGVDAFAIPEFIESKIILTNSSGIHGTPVGENAFLHMIMLAKNARRIFDQMREKRWEGFMPIILESKTVGILGLGPIGKYIAKLSKGFGMRVLAVKARPSAGYRYTDAIFPPQKLHEVLSQCDFVVNALPLLTSTVKIIGEPELRAMKSTAIFVNIGRGDTVDQDALIRALSENWIAGAGLDVVTPEPLPPDSKLWELPNVSITPRMANRREGQDQLATDLFCENLKLYISGRGLFNVIDKKTLVSPV